MIQCMNKSAGNTLLSYKQMKKCTERCTSVTMLQIILMSSMNGK